MANKNNITDMPYAQWLEETLQEITSLPIQGIVLACTLANGDVYAAYYNISMRDKLVLSGVINQDATLDMLAAQGIIEYEEEEEEETEEDDMMEDY